MRVAVCGGGVIGCAIAYELSKRKADVTLIERHQVAGSASGKSGGFLARDWCDGTAVQQLAHRSFDLHAVWAEELGNIYGYRAVDTYGAVMSARRSLGSGGDETVAAWLSDAAVHRSRLGTKSSTAQLDPEAFTVALAEAACARGGKMVEGAVAGLQADEAGRTRGVVLDCEEVIEAEAVVLAMGPWSVLAAQWLPLPPVYGLKGHSVVFRCEASLPAEAVFAEFEDEQGEIFAPEIVPRPDGTLYVCGISGQGALPVDPSRVGPEKGGCEKLRAIAAALVPQIRGAEVVSEQACFRPIMQDGLPLIGHVPGHEGCHVATGHSVWGMLNAPGTAEAIAELLVEGETSHVDLSPFSVDRLTPLDPKDLALQR